MIETASVEPVLPAAAPDRRTPGSSLVLGTWALGGALHGTDGPLGYGAVSAEQAATVLGAAWRAGCRLVDSADVYGGGEALRRVGAWQSPGRRFEVAWKVGRPLVDGRARSALAPQQLAAQLAAVRAVAGEPSVVLLKDPPLELYRAPDAMFRVLADLRRLAPGARTGIATHRLAECMRLERVVPGEILQLEYNGVNWPVASRVAHALCHRGWEIWAMQPLAHGFLAGRHGPEHRFAGDDWRSRLGPELRSRIEAAASAFRSALRAQASRASAATVALAWLLTDPCVERVVVGPKSPEQLDDALHALVLCADLEFRARAQRMRASVRG